MTFLSRFIIYFRLINVGRGILILNFKKKILLISNFYVQFLVVIYFILYFLVISYWILSLIHVFRKNLKPIDYNHHFHKLLYLLTCPNLNQLSYLIIKFFIYGMIINSESFDINDNFDVVMIYCYQIIIIDSLSFELFVNL